MLRALAILALLVVGACGAPDQEVVFDLTHPFDAETIYWPTEEGFVLERGTAGTTPGGYYYEAHRFRSAEHGGTHLDAPVHFQQSGASVDQIPVERLIGPGVLVDVTAACARDRDHEVSRAELEEWEALHGEIPNGAVVLLRTGFGARWPDRAAYLGTDQRGPAAVSQLHFPGLAADAASWLVSQRAIRAVGIDTASIDHGPSERFDTHRVLAAAGVPSLENVAGLENLPVQGFRVAALPMLIRGGSGAPVRIVAFVPEPLVLVPTR